MRPPLFTLICIPILAAILPAFLGCRQAISGAGQARLKDVSVTASPIGESRASVSAFSGNAPRIGHIEIGAFAPEAAARCGITDLSLLSMDGEYTYAQYRTAVRVVYGADLADMNYLAVGKPDWKERFPSFHDWLFRAAQYGDPTIAIEPLGMSGYGAFSDTPEMRCLRDIFSQADGAGITVWVRFASESNLRNSAYSVYNNRAKIRRYRLSVRWFRTYMPRNVRLVFSPLINTAYLRDPSQLATLREMYVAGDYDRIGGTLYATTRLRLKPAYTWYHGFMRRLDPDCPFQICELGGMFSRRADIEDFLHALADGAWPDVKRVNLFAGDLNTIAVGKYGHFGLLEPGASVSYVAEFFGVPLGQTYGTIAPSIVAASQSPATTTQELTLEGTVLQIGRRKDYILLQVDAVTDSIGDTVMLSPPRRKRVLLGQETAINADTQGSFPAVHARVQTTGWDTGTGTSFHAASLSTLDPVL